MDAFAATNQTPIGALLPGHVEGAGTTRAAPKPLGRPLKTSRIESSMNSTFAAFALRRVAETDIPGLQQLEPMLEDVESLDRISSTESSHIWRSLRLLQPEHAEVRWSPGCKKRTGPRPTKTLSPQSLNLAPAIAPAHAFIRTYSPGASQMAFSGPSPGVRGATFSGA